jgi:hypothetical protein
MIYDSEFKQVGKKMPYYVPDGFFEGITEKTLDEARLREKSRRKYVLIWRSMAIAASLTALIAAGYLLINLFPTEKTGQAAQNISAGLQDEVKNEEFREVINTMPVKKDNDINNTESNTIHGSVDDEGINDVLTSLTREELLELAAMLTSDMFMEETDNFLQ